MNAQRRPKSRGRKPRTKNNKPYRQGGDPGPAIVNLSRWRIQPPRVHVRLRYTTAGTLTAVGGLVTSKTFYCNALYDVDPSLGSTAIAGFNEWSALYGSNRVLRCHVTVRFTNQEAFPISVANGFFAQVMAAGAFTNGYYGNRFCQQKFLPPKGGMDRGIFQNTIDINQLFGNYATTGDLNHFYGTALSNPTTLFSWCLGISSPTGVVFTAAGLPYVLDMDFDCEFSQALALNV